jgi:hypothetical protein
MKATNVVLVWEALLLRALSVEAFQQSSSTGYLNTLTRTSSKLIPMHGYLDSLGNTATTYKDKVSSEAFLPRRYEAEYPPRHAYGNVAVYPVQQSVPSSLQASSKASTDTETGSTTIYQYGQITSPSELLGNTYVNMMGAVPEMMKEPTRTIEDTPQPDVVVHTTAKISKTRTAIDTPNLRFENHAVPAAAEMVKGECR